MNETAKADGSSIPISPNQLTGTFDYSRKNSVGTPKSPMGKLPSAVSSPTQGNAQLEDPNGKKGGFFGFF
jgi:hypothetical protein